MIIVAFLFFILMAAIFVIALFSGNILLAALMIIAGVIGWYTTDADTTKED